MDAKCCLKSSVAGIYLEAHKEVAEGGGAGDGMDTRQHHNAIFAAAGQPKPLVHPAARRVLVCPQCQPSYLAGMCMHAEICSKDEGTHTSVPLLMMR